MYEKGFQAGENGAEGVFFLRCLASVTANNSVAADRNRSDTNSSRVQGAAIVVKLHIRSRRGITTLT